MVCQPDPSFTETELNQNTQHEFTCTVQAGYCDSQMSLFVYMYYFGLESLYPISVYTCQMSDIILKFKF